MNKIGVTCHVGERIAIHAKQAVKYLTVSKRPFCISLNVTSVTLTRLATPAYRKETIIWKVWRRAGRRKGG